MNFAIKQPWYSKKISFRNEEKSITKQQLLFFEKPFFIDNKTIMAIQFDIEYINKIKKEKRKIDQNIFYDFNCDQYKHPKLVKEHLKNDYILNIIYNKIVENNKNNQLLKQLKKQQIQFLNLYLQ